MSPSTIVFCGTPCFACPSLQALHDDPAFDVVQVITQPDKPVGRKKVITAPPVKVLAKNLGLSVLQPKNISNVMLSPSTSTAGQAEDEALMQCNFLVVVAYGQKISAELLAWPKIAAVNLHPSLLPHLRGPSPIQNILLEGAKETGVTIQRMVEKIDAGPILGQESVKIDARETKESLEGKLAGVGGEFLVETLKGKGEVPQDESLVTHCKKLTRASGYVDPALMTAEEIDRYVRALVPWPGVRIVRSNSDLRSPISDNIKLHETSLTSHPNAFELPCKDGTVLYVIKMQSPGKRVVTGKEWGRGNEPIL